MREVLNAGIALPQEGLASSPRSRPSSSIRPHSKNAAAQALLNRAAQTRLTRQTSGRV
jgi:hypothetical protein